MYLKHYSNGVFHSNLIESNMNVIVSKDVIMDTPDVKGLSKNTDMSFPLQWRNNGCDGASNHKPHYCLLNHLFKRRSKKASKLRVTGLCVGNSPVTDEFPAQRTSNAENVSIWRRHHVLYCLAPIVIKIIQSGMTLYCVVMLYLYCVYGVSCYNKQHYMAKTI